MMGCGCGEKFVTAVGSGAELGAWPVNGCGLVAGAAAND